MVRTRSRPVGGFQECHEAELDDRRDIVDPARAGRITLVSGARDERRNNVVVLRDVIERRRWAVDPVSNAGSLL